MSRTFAIGDIHGCSLTLVHLLHHVLRIEPGDTLYFLGDTIDRGPDSKGVIDLILSLKEKGYTIETLRGNHEQLMMDSVQSPEQFMLWMRNGGDATLRSFDVDTYAELPDTYKQFFESTRHYVETEKHILVHAGLNFSAEDIFSDTHAMLWIRNMETDIAKLGNRIVVHGHTPKPLDFILSQTNTPTVNLDAGCVYKAYPQLGNLVALELHTHTFFTLPNCEI